MKAFQSPAADESDYVSARHFYPRTCMTMNYSCSLRLRLNGYWQGEVGFSTDTPVTVSVESGKLLIEPVKG